HQPTNLAILVPYTTLFRSNGTLCSTEQAIVVHQNIKEMTVRELKNNGGYFLDSSEKAMLENVISPSKGKLNPKIVGRSARIIAEDRKSTRLNSSHVKTSYA